MPVMQAEDLFTLTTIEAAKALDTTPTQLRHLVRSGLLGYYAPADLSGKSQVRMLFSLDQLLAYRDARKRGDIPVDRTNTANVADYLREYLDELEPSDDYDEAMFQRRPLLASSKSGPQVYIKVESFVEHMAEYAGVTLVPSLVEKSLEYLGAIRRRGVIPLADAGSAKQRWATWWRVPPFFLRGNDTDEQLGASILRSVIPGERVKRTRELPRDEAGQITSPIGKTYLDDSTLGTD